MADVLKQTLYWNANPTHDAVFVTGDSTLISRGRSITAAESHDASDATYERIQANVDGASEFNADGYGDVYGALQTASASGAISFVRVKGRVKTAAYSGAGSGSVGGGIQPLINGVLRGSEDAGGASFANVQQDFATDPADAAAWTNAKVNAQTFGQRVRAAATDADTSWTTGCRTDLAEFSVELWGPDAQTSTPASVAVVVAVGAAAILIGAVASSCTSTSAPCAANNATGTAGLRVVSPASVEAVGTAGLLAAADGVVIAPGDPGSFGRTGAWNPAAVVPLSVLADGGSAPVTLRCNTAPMYDQNLGTFASDADGFGVPGTAAGTLVVGATGMAQTSIASPGSGAISGVVFFAYVRGRKDAHVTLSNWRVCGQAVSAPPVGNTTPPFADFGLLQTGLVAVDGGALAWDWATIFAKLAALGIGVRADYAFSGGHEFDESVQLDVAEIWCEVHGPVGLKPDVIRITHVIDAHRKQFKLKARV